MRLTGRGAAPQEVPPPGTSEPSQGSRVCCRQRHGSWTRAVRLAASGKTLRLPAPSGRTLRLSGKTLQLPATGSGKASDAPSGKRLQLPALSVSGKSAMPVTLLQSRALLRGRPFVAFSKELMLSCKRVPLPNRKGTFPPHPLSHRLCSHLTQFAKSVEVDDIKGRKRKQSCKKKTD